MEREEEGETGWRFHAVARDAAGREWPFTLLLAWADYNLWSPDGSDAPQEVARAALLFMLGREPAAEISSTFDAARIRRRYADADVVIPTLIARGRSDG